MVLNIVNLDCSVVGVDPEDKAMAGEPTDGQHSGWNPR